MSEHYKRLSDLILQALKLSVEQQDIELSNHLNNALELAMTRGSGGEGFVERREFSEDIETVLSAYQKLIKDHS